tara:strand:- start:1324 stop:2001 length:678 start_codon:yes stop_codon:yes gene_type:complete
MKSMKLFLVTIPRYSILTVLLCLGLSIIFYEGGTMNDPSSMGYSFTRNFFSDLGQYTPENMVSLILFATALTVCGLTFNAYFFYFIKLFPEKNIYKNLAITGCIAGMFGGFCFFGVGVTPSNTTLDPHIFFANWAFRSFLITSILLSIVLFKDKRFNTLYAGGYALFALLIFIYVLILELAPSPRISDFSLMFNVVSQKAIVLVFICSVLMQSFGNLKIINDSSV